MHREHGNAYVDSIYAEVGDIHCNSAAAARVYRAELAYLPYYAVILKDIAEIAEIFGGSVVGVGLAAGSGILVDGRAAVWLLYTSPSPRE